MLAEEKIKIELNYKIVKQIGQGSYSCVYLVEDKDKNRFAMKNLDNVSSPYKIEELALKDKLKDCSKINMPILNDDKYIIYNYFKNGDLKHYIKANGALSESQVKILLLDMIEALHLIHTNNIIHNDIKPFNIFIDEDGGFVLSDFGLSENRRGSFDDISRSIKGTMEYIAPEKFKKEYSYTSDIYSLGCVLFFALTAKLPYGIDEDDDMASTVYAHLEKELVIPDSISSDMGNIIKNMMLKDPKERYTIKQIKEAIEKLEIQNDTIDTSNIKFVEKDFKSKRDISREIDISGSFDLSQISKKK
ncbi:MAG: serine/threonine-protein kinase [Campylobacterota bacterium]|nr:serine/threonine-protein kinase [Campylobacterota bacterium]